MSANDTITITAGSREGAYRGEVGNLPGVLVSHTIYPPEDQPPLKSKQNPNETYRLREWGFSIHGAPDDADMVWVTSGMSTGPKSKTYGIIQALLAGKQPPVGTTLDINKHLIGRMALVTVEESEKGYLDGKTVTAMPAALLAQLSPNGAAADARTAAAPKPAPVAVADANPDDLPF
jgi:hypothetical protein